jgi:hypothetical protein
VYVALNGDRVSDWPSTFDGNFKTLMIFLVNGGASTTLTSNGKTIMQAPYVGLATIEPSAEVFVKAGSTSHNLKVDSTDGFPAGTFNMKITRGDDETLMRNETVEATLSGDTFQITGLVTGINVGDRVDTDVSHKPIEAECRIAGLLWDVVVFLEPAALGDEDQVGDIGKFKVIMEDTNTLRLIESSMWIKIGD